MLHKIGILSDTHNLLRPEVLAALAGSEQILHGGDISSREILDQLEQIAPVSVVRGNNDHEWAEGMPETLDLTVCGIRIFMIHNKKFLPKDLSAYDLVIYGHSHKYEDKELNGVHFFNPGSCGPRRFHQEITLAILWVEDDREDNRIGDRIEDQAEDLDNNLNNDLNNDPNTNLNNASNKNLNMNSNKNLNMNSKKYRIEKIIIPHAAPAVKSNATDEASIPSRDVLIRMLPAIMQEIDAGKTTAQIAKKHKIPQDLSDGIARMYLTHPGVDIDGILRRLNM